MLDTIPIFCIDTLQNVVKLPSVEAEVALSMMPLRNDTFSSPWLVLCFLVLFCLYCLSLSASLNYLNVEMKTFFSEKERVSFSMSFPPQYTYAKLYFSILAVLSIGYFIFRFVQLFTESKSTTLILVFSVALLVFLLLSDILLFLIGCVFFRKKHAIQYLKKQFFLIAFVGVFLFPLDILSIYTPTGIGIVFQWIAIFLIAIFAIVLIYKLLQIFFEKFVALFYLLLYLCIWKILPFIAFVKMLGETDLIVGF